MFESAAPRLRQVLVCSDSYSWGIVPTTRRRLPFDARWPGVPELELARSFVGTLSLPASDPP